MFKKIFKTSPTNKLFLNSNYTRREFYFVSTSSSVLIGRDNFYDVMQCYVVRYNFRDPVVLNMVIKLGMNKIFHNLQRTKGWRQLPRVTLRDVINHNTTGCLKALVRPNSRFFDNLDILSRPVMRSADTSPNVTSHGDEP